MNKTKEGVIVLIDEIHTPDSSRYLYRRISGKAG
jgi:phosphoribosylaminoimidazole-succinocarboxamide synthase